MYSDCIMELAANIIGVTRFSGPYAEAQLFFGAHFQ